MAIDRLRRLTRQPTFTYPLVAFGALIVGFLLYYFPVAAHQEARLDERAFRVLGRLGEQFGQRVVAKASALHQASTLIDPGGGEADREPDDAADDGSDDPAATASTRDVALRPVERFVTAQVPGLALHECPKGESLRSATADSGAVALSSTQELLHLRSIASAARNEPDLCGSLSWDDAFVPFLDSLPAGLFDEVLLARIDGEVLFQTRRSGVRVQDLRGLALRPAGSTPYPGNWGGTEASDAGETSAPPGLQASQLYRVALGGKEYRLYVSPVHLGLQEESRPPRPTAARSPGEATPPGDAASDDVRSGVSARFAVCGLTRADRFESRKSAIPNWTLVAIVLILFALIAGSWPALKFQTIRPTEVIRRRSGLAYLWTGMLTTATLSILAIHLSFGDKRVDARLEHLAEAIESNLGEEIEQALDTLGAIVTSGPFEEQIKEVARSRSTGRADGSTDGAVAGGQVRHYRTELLRKRDVGVADYPYFEMVFSADREGKQQIKWTVRRQPTPAVDLRLAPYLQAALRNDFWRFEGEPAACEHRFRVDPRFSPNTGEYLAVVSRPTCEDGDALLLHAMVVPLMSLIHPILPPDNGFAVVDPSGLVLFHSDASRSHAENFFNEVSDDQVLRGIVRSGQAEHLTAEYLDVPHRLYVTPLATLRGCPWTLIVFRDLQNHDAQQVLSIWLVFGLMIGCIALLGIAGRMVRLPDYPPTQLLPSSDRVSCYYHVALVLVAVLATSYFLLFELSASVVPVAVFALPISAITGAVMKLFGRERAVFILASVFWLCAVLGVSIGPTWVSAWAFVLLSGVAALYVFLSLPSALFQRLPALGADWSYSLVAALLLATCTLIPVVGFFRLSHDHYEYQFARNGQIETREELTRRQLRVESSYRSLGLGPGRADGLASWLFLRRRLDLNALDRYDTKLAEGKSFRLCADCSSSRGASWGWAPAVAGWVQSWLPRGDIVLAGRAQDEGAPARGWGWDDRGTTWLRFRRLGVNEPLDRSPETAALAHFLAGNGEFESLDMVTELEYLEPEDLLAELLWTLALALVVWYRVRNDVIALFGLRFRSGQDWGALTERGDSIRRNTVVVGPSGAGRRADLDPKGDAILWLDPSGDRGEQIERLEREPHRIVGFDRFDDDIANVDKTLAKIELLEYLLYEQTTARTVLILASADPLFLISQELVPNEAPTPVGRHEREELARRAEILKNFRYKRIEVPGGSRERYSELWSACTRTERAALYQLAAEGWPNYRNERALRHLEGRGVISTTPGVRILDEQFRQHVLSCTDSEAARTLRSHEAPSAWQGVRLALVVVSLAILGVALYFSRNEFMGIVISSMSLVAPALQLVVAARRAQAALAPSGEVA